MAANYHDEHGGWDARLGPNGEFLGGALVEPSAAFEAARASVPPPPPPGPSRDEKLADAFEVIGQDPALSASSKAAIAAAVTELRGAS